MEKGSIRSTVADVPIFSEDGEEQAEPPFRPQERGGGGAKTREDRKTHPHVLHTTWSSQRDQAEWTFHNTYVFEGGGSLSPWAPKSPSWDSPIQELPQGEGEGSGCEEVGPSLIPPFCWVLLPFHVQIPATSRTPQHLPNRCRGPPFLLGFGVLGSRLLPWKGMAMPDILACMGPRGVQAVLKLHL